MHEPLQAAETAARGFPPPAPGSAQMSCEACFRMSMSIFTPKALSIRSAISPDRSALPFSKLERAGRDTRNALAASVTVNPAGSTISVRMKSPGCGGFLHGNAGCSCVSGNLPNLRHRSRARQCQRETSNGGSRERSGVAHIVKEAEHLAQPVHGIGWHAARAVSRAEPLQGPCG